MKVVQLPFTLQQLSPATIARAKSDWGDQDPLAPLPGYFNDAPERWLAEHNAQARSHDRAAAQVVFVGDSITRGWGNPAQTAIWERHFAPFSAQRVAIDGDRTQQMLWRFEHGALDGFAPRVVVLLLGVNNLWSGRQNNVRVAPGLAAVLAGIRARLPTSRILHLGILPTQNPATHPVRVAAVEINALCASCADGHSVHYLDAGRPFVGADGLISPTLMPDLCHLSPRGYELFAGEITPALHHLLAI